MAKTAKQIKVRRGDIWKVANDLDLIVVPTNIGWTRNGTNVMGRGVARQAAQQEDPMLPAWYGRECERLGADTPVLARGRVILFPVKPLIEQTPWMSWAQPARLELIERSFDQLRYLKRPDKRSKILIPLVGCGNGSLDFKSQVLPIMKQWWRNRYRLVLKKRG